MLVHLVKVDSLCCDGGEVRAIVFIFSSTRRFVSEHSLQILRVKMQLFSLFSSGARMTRNLWW